MHLPLLSICCLGYNHANFLQENLDSIVRINYKNIEVIVVDDGSTDNSADILQKLAKNFPLPITIISQENTGNIGKNFNTAIQHANGELISFIALDDVFRPDTMLASIQLMAKNPSLAFIAAKTAVAINDTGLVINKLPPLPIEELEHISIDELLEFEYTQFGSFYIQGCIFRKSIIDAISGFDEDMTGDDIILRTKLFRHLKQNFGWEYSFIHDNTVFYRLHDNNVHKNGTRQIRIVSEYLDKYWPNKPNPQTLIDWAKWVIQDKKFEEAISLFSMNKRAATLLSDPTIQQTLQHILYRESKLNKIIKKYIYRKERPTSEIRKLIFFGIIPISYRRKKQISSDLLPLVHYSNYK
jgi:Glycosyltransferases, probably involved in cell wall biogenesis